MNEAFEMLPFAGQPGAAGEQEWLGEWSQEWSQDAGRGGRGRMGRRALRARWRARRHARRRLRARPPLRGTAPSRAAALPGQQGRRPPRYAAQPLPYLPPRYRGWGGYRGHLSHAFIRRPIPCCGTGQRRRPEPDRPDQGQDQGRRSGAGRWPDAGRSPTYPGRHHGPGAGSGRLAITRRWARSPMPCATRTAAGPGLYVIEFDTGGRRRAYSGQTDDLHRRLLQHRLCGQMMGIDMSGHQVYVAPLSSAAQRRRIEKRIHRRHVRQPARRADEPAARTGTGRAGRNVGLTTDSQALTMRRRTSCTNSNAHARNAGSGPAPRLKCWNSARTGPARAARRPSSAKRKNCSWPWNCWKWPARRNWSSFSAMSSRACGRASRRWARPSPRWPSPWAAP